MRAAYPAHLITLMTLVKSTSYEAPSLSNHTGYCTPTSSTYFRTTKSANKFHTYIKQQI